MSNMNLKKMTAIGIIALFFGLMIVPVNGASIEKTEQKIPVEFSMVNTDGSVGSQIISLTDEQIEQLQSLIDSIRYDHNQYNILDKLRHFLNSLKIKGCDGLLHNRMLNIPGKFIASFGFNGELLNRYHARTQIKKVIGAWHYPDYGFTYMYGLGKDFGNRQQLLTFRQMGFMAGFAGIYIYIPDYAATVPSCTFFAGYAAFAWGISY